MCGTDPNRQPLCTLDQALVDFPDQFATILAGRASKDHIPHVEHGDGTCLVEYMNTVRIFPTHRSYFLKVAQVLNGFIPGCPAEWEVIHALGWVCGSRGILLKSLVVSEPSLGVSSQSVTSGSFGDIYKGTLNGRDVSVKTLRICNSNERSMVKKVRRWRYRFSFTTEKTDRNFARRLCPGDT